jgi:flagellar operon protein
MQVNGTQLPFIPAGGLDNSPVARGFPPGKVRKPFDEIFTEELGSVKFSGHAKSRIEGRNIDLSDTDILRLENAVQNAAGKNSREALVLLDDKALIVNVKNRTVVTLVNKTDLNDNVITNIDSAVFA